MYNVGMTGGRDAWEGWNYLGKKETHTSNLVKRVSFLYISQQICDSQIYADFKTSLYIGCLRIILILALFFFSFLVMC